MKTRREFAQVAMCIMAGILAGAMLLLEVPLKWKIVLLAAIGIGVLVSLAGSLTRILLAVLAFSVPIYFGKELIVRPEHLGLAMGTGIRLTDILALALLLSFLANLALRQVKINPLSSISQGR